jgi:oligopeptidase A
VPLDAPRFEVSPAAFDAGSIEGEPANPLLQKHGLPAFDRLRPQHVGAAVETLLAEADAALERAVSDAVAADYDALSAVLDVAVERLGRAWGAVGHLNEVADTPAWRAAYNASLPAVTDFHTRLGAEGRLYRKYLEVAASPGAARFGSARRVAMEHSLRDFVLAGAQLQGDAAERFAQIQERAAELRQRFSENVLDATERFEYFANQAELAGVPDDVIRVARAEAQALGREGCRLTLRAPCYVRVMQCAQSRGLRERLYRAHATRASELGDADLDNSALMRELLELRHEEARLLGYANYADLSLVPKMAQSSAQVDNFLLDLARRARPFGERDLAELREFAARELGMPDLEPWDIDFASERLKQARYAFSSADLRQYFSEAHVLDGLFHIVETLFELEIRPHEAAVWHDSVRCYSMRRDGALIGQFYIDLHARPGKRAGAWMDHAQQRWLRPDATGLQLPVAILVCNFAAPEVVDGQTRPALLSHDDLITLFHEFGHGLHHLLTQVDELAVAGLSGVEWDAVEMPSQLMENFCWEWQVLQRLSAHVDTGEAMPRALFDKLVAARNFHSGLDMLRHLEHALFDLRIHCDCASPQHLRQIADELHAQVAVLPAAAFNRFAHSFSHIFEGGYAAGYYSYAWAEVLSADAWSAFEEAGVFDLDTGRRWRQAVLELGGSRAAIDNFKAFRGREPRIDALLRHRGMA